MITALFLNLSCVVLIRLFAVLKSADVGTEKWDLVLNTARVLLPNAIILVKNFDVALVEIASAVMNLSADLVFRDLEVRNLSAADPLSDSAVINLDADLDASDNTLV